MGNNAGEDLLKMIVKVLWWFIKLLPNIIKGIFRGVKGLINMIKNKGE